MLFLDEFRMTSPQVEQLIQTRITESEQYQEIKQLASVITKQLASKG
jgi:hypothetical protein